MKIRSNKATAEVWNTTVWWGYLYQWWLSALLYLMLQKKRLPKLRWNMNFNKKVAGLLKHLSRPSGRFLVKNRHIYVEWDREYFEDINVLGNFLKGVGYGFIQSKTTRNGTYWVSAQIQKIVASFYENQHFQVSPKNCVFIIACNVKIDSAVKSLIYSNDTGFKITVIEKILGMTVCQHSHLRHLVALLESGRNLSSIAKYLWPQPELWGFLKMFETISDLFEKIYFFDDISIEEIMESIESIRKGISKEKLLYEITYKATRKKIVCKEDTDFSLYKEYPKTMFGWEIEKDTIEGGFLVIRKSPPASV